MNRFTAIKEVTEMNNKILAESTGIDPVAIYVFEHNLAPTHLNTVYALCETLDVLIEDMFPNISPILAASHEMSDKEALEFYTSQPNKVAMLSAGLDPDIREWIMIVDFRSGAERRYHVSSFEMGKVREKLLSSESAASHICFYSDCQQVILAKEGIAEVTFATGASYAMFSSKEKAFTVSMLFEGDPMPSMIEVMPDGVYNSEEKAPFANILQAAMNDSELPKFFEVTTGNDDDFRIISLASLDALEVPLGIFFPLIYDFNSDARYVGMGSELDSMDAVGSA